MEDVRTILLNASSKSSVPIYDALDAYLTIASISFVKSRRKKIVDVLGEFLEEEKINQEEYEKLVRIVAKEIAPYYKALINYEKYFKAFIASRVSIKKGYAICLMPFLVAETIEELFSIQQSDVHFQKTTKNALIVTFKTSKREYHVYIHTNVKLFEKMYQENQLVNKSADPKNPFVFKSDIKDYSACMRAIRNKIDQCFGNYLNVPIETIESNNRTILSLLKEDVKNLDNFFFFKQL